MRDIKEDTFINHIREWGCHYAPCLVPAELIEIRTKEFCCPGPGYSLPGECPEDQAFRPVRALWSGVIARVVLPPSFYLGNTR